MTERVLVTGGTGYLAQWCITRLIEHGYRVRTTVRDDAKAEQVSAALASAGTPTGSLEFARADLLDDAGWDAAVSGCSGVLHVASPLVATRNEAEVIGPAVDGTLRVLRAARDAGVKRVVYTSSCGAVYYGHPPRNTPFTESDWTIIGGGPMSAYVKSKALAERAAWDWMQREGDDLELSVINPAGIFGPALSAAATSSLGLISRLLAGMPGVPDLRMGIVDVRDVADLHLLALTTVEAAGERFIAWSQGPVSLTDIARVLREGLGANGRKVPTRKLPDWLVRAVGLVNTEIGDLVPLLGEERTATSAKAREVLGWSPRPWEGTIIESAQSLRHLGVIG